MDGDILERLASEGAYTEARAAEVVKRLTLGFRDYHLTTGRVLACLKAEGVLYRKENEEYVVKIDIFSASTIMPTTQSLKPVDSSDVFFSAPEKLNGGKLDFSSDIWSVGIMAYLLLCGYPPFYDENLHVGLEAIQQVKFNFPAEDWGNITQGAKDLISNILKKTPDERYTTELILQSGWMTGGSSTELLPTIVNERLKKFRATFKIKAVTDAVFFVNKLVKNISN